MDAMTVVMLRGICERQIEQTITPLLKDLQTRQKKLEEELRNLTSAAPLAASAAGGNQIRDLIERVEKLENTGIADLAARLEEQVSDGPTMEQFDALAALVDTKAAGNNAVSVSQFRALQDKVERKANSSKVPTLQQLQELKEMVEDKADKKSVPCNAQFDDLLATLERRTNPSVLPSSQQMQKLTLALEKKADASSVASQAKLDEVAAALANKAKKDDVPSMEQFEGLASRFATTEQLRELTAKVNKFENTMKGSGRQNNYQGQMGGNSSGRGGGRQNMTGANSNPMGNNNSNSNNSNNGNNGSNSNNNNNNSNGAGPTNSMNNNNSSNECGGGGCCEGVCSGGCNGGCGGCNGCHGCNGMPKQWQSPCGAMAGAMSGTMSGNMPCGAGPGGSGVVWLVPAPMNGSGQWDVGGMQMPQGAAVWTTPQANDGCMDGQQWQQQ